MDLGWELLIGLSGALIGAILMRSSCKKQEAARKRLSSMQAARERSVEAARRRERAAQFDVKDTENQRRFISEASLRSRKPINAEAYKTVFVVVERTLAEMPGKKHRILAEVSMGSFIGTSRDMGSEAAQKRAFSSFNSKRVDFLIIDAYGNPQLVIEYQGSGHYQGNAMERDAVKRLALEKANIRLLEIHEGATPKEVVSKVRHRLQNDRVIQ